MAGKGALRASRPPRAEAIAFAVGEVMSKLNASIVMASLFLPTGSASAQAILGPDAAACRSTASGPAALVIVSGFKNRNGLVRVQLYGANPNDFLAKGKYLRRVELPISAASMQVCVALPGSGLYAIAVRHDADGDGKSGWSDGGGFSRNPAISLANLRPRHSDVAFRADGGVERLNVVLNYRQGLSIKPIGRN
jgi:uncharacterized protein (DUF2141 family)